MYAVFILTTSQFGDSCFTELIKLGLSEKKMFSLFENDKYDIWEHSHQFHTEQHSSTDTTQVG